MAASRGSGNALDSLLVGVPGFNRPSMADMRSKGVGSKFAAAASPPPPNRTAPNPPSSASETPEASAGSFGVEHLEHMMKSQSTPSLAQQKGPASASSGSLGSLGQRNGSATASGAFDDLLGGLGAPGSRGGGGSMRQAQSPAGPGPAAPVGASQPAAPQPQQPPAAAAPAEEDPFALFGGPPPAAASGGAAQPAATSGSAAAQLPVTDIDDGFLAAFAAPQPQPGDAQQQRRQQQQQQQQAAAAAPASPPRAADFGDFLGGEEREAPAAVRGSPPRQAARSQPAASHTAGYGYDTSPPAAAAGQSRYRVFDYVQAEEDQGHAGAAAGHAPAQHGGGGGSDCGVGPLEQGMRGGGGGGVLAADTYAGQHPGSAKEVASELSQRAAKAFQSGTKWFMKASKTLVTQVQARLDAGGGGGGGAAPPPAASGDPQPFHRDWAAQLARISPTSRAAALGAMSEDDRLAVQRVLDESSLGRRSGSAHGGKEREQERQADSAAAAARATPPPPPYDAVAGGDRGRPAAAEGPARQAATAAQRVQPAQREDQEDLLGMAGPAAARPAAPEQAAAPAGSGAVGDDLLGFGDAPSAAAGTAGTSTNAAGTAASTAHIDSLFSVPAATRPGAAAAGGGGRSGGASWAPSAGLDSMIDLGGDLPEVDASAYADLYRDAEAEGGAAADEPEVRRRLRQKRIQEKHERMQRQLAEARAREEAEEAEKAGKVELRATLQPRIDAWAAGKKDNIRALLASLHTVLWEGSGWKQPSMADMVENGKVKRMYMKANLVVHPDKVKQKGGSLEQVATADAVFHVLKSAWAKFDA